MIIAGAGGAAHLPGMLAAKTLLPVIGVPIPTQHLGGHGFAAVDRPDAARHPGRDGRDRQRENAALLAAQILALSDAALAERLDGLARGADRRVLDDPSNARADGSRLGGTARRRSADQRSARASRRVLVRCSPRSSAVLSTTRTAIAAAGAPVNEIASAPKMIVTWRTTSRP